MFRATEEEKLFLFEYVPGHHYSEIVSAFNERFETQITKEQIKSFIGRYKLNTGFNGQYRKGRTPENKGKKQVEYMTSEAIERTAATRFKKGQKPINHRAVGSERITKDGYIEIKVGEPNKWKLKQRYVYETQVGSIPKGHIVIFKDNNRLNCDKENLLCISRKQNAVMNHAGWQVFTGECKETASLIAEMKIQVRNKKVHKK